MFLFHSSRTEGPNQKPLSYEKTWVWCLVCQSTKIGFLGCFSLPVWNYVGMWCHGAFIIHFPVSAYFVSFVYLDVFFSNSILSRWLSAIYFNFCVTSLWLCMWHILKVIWKLRHWHLSISTDTAKLYLSLAKIFWKDKTFMINATLVLSYLAPILWYNYSFLSDFFYPSRDIHWFITSWTRMFN